MASLKGSTLSLVDTLDAADAAAWNVLVESQPSANPFMRIEYLRALTDSGSAVAGTGWSPLFLLAHASGALVAATALYAKDHSYGEYVFDWAWADAYERHGLRYYPKLLGAVPFTPVPGPRLLARDLPGRVALLRGIEAIARRAGLSSAHLLFLDENDLEAARACGWQLRTTVQFHWMNREPDPWPDFAAFLASVKRDKRKKIQQERRRVADAGVTFEVLEGAAIGDADWDFFHRCYVRTYRAHGSTPYLTRDFFRRAAAAQPETWLLFVARQGGERIAASLLVIDPLRRAAYGRYWGATRHVDCLHFEACYYQPLAWCIANGYRRFEGGAQGEHKMARGLLPVQTWSAHWLAEPRFAAAIGSYLEHEGARVESYLDELNERQPFKDGAAPGPALEA